MTDAALQAVAEVLGAAYRDSAWNSLGFPGRPRGGRFWRKHFRAEWKNRLDHGVLQQIIALFTVASVLTSTIQRRELHEVVALYADGTAHVQSLYRTLGYETRDEAVTHLYECITQYLDAKPSEWPTLLTKRLGIFDLPDKVVGARLLVGVVQFSVDIESMVEDIRRASAGRTG